MYKGQERRKYKRIEKPYNTRALSVIPVTLAGLLFLWREGMSLGEISKYEE